MQDAKEALIWIVKILRRHKITFHIAGGFAAKIYGSIRELADIDIDIPEERFPDIVEDVKEYIKYGPKQYKDSSWDLLLMTLKYRNQEIDIAGAYQSKLFNTNNQRWESAKTNFEKDEIKEVFGIKVPVISRQELIEYKTKLKRDVDVEDLKALLNSE